MRGPKSAHVHMYACVVQCPSGLVHVHVATTATCIDIAEAKKETKEAPLGENLETLKSKESEATEKEPSDIDDTSHNVTINVTHPGSLSELSFARFPAQQPVFATLD